MRSGKPERNSMQRNWYGEQTTTEKGHRSMWNWVNNKPLLGDRRRTLVGFRVEHRYENELGQKQLPGFMDLEKNYNSEHGVSHKWVV